VAARATAIRTVARAVARVARATAIRTVARAVARGRRSSEGTEPAPPQPHRVG
jgi:hypothetical protein